MSLKRVRLNNLSTQKVTGRSLRLSRLSRKRFPFPSAAVAAAAAVYIEDVFSTFLHTGAGTSKYVKVTNNLDLSTSGQSWSVLNYGTSISFQSLGYGNSTSRADVNGTYYSLFISGSDTLLVRFDSNNNKIAERTITSFIGVSVDYDGTHVAVLGQPSGGSNDIVLVKFNNSFVRQFDTKITASAGTNTARHVVIESDGTVIIGFENSSQAHMYAYNMSGTVVWNKRYYKTTSSNQESSIFAMKLGSDGHVYIAGGAHFVTTNFKEIYVAKVATANGNLQWTYSAYNGWGSTQNKITGMEVTSNAVFLASAQYGQYNGSNYTVPWFGKINLSGTEQWSKDYPTQGPMSIGNPKLSTDGTNVYATVPLYTFGNACSVMKFDTDGLLLNELIVTDDTSAPDSAELYYLNQKPIFNYRTKSLLLNSTFNVAQGNNGTTSVRTGPAKTFTSSSTGYYSGGTVTAETTTATSVGSSNTMSSSNTTNFSLTSTTINSKTASNGLVWIKKRSAVSESALFDTLRGRRNYLVTSTTAAQTTTGSGFDEISFDADGFAFASSATRWNESGATFASWAFRKQPKFFDVVYYTGVDSGSGTNSQTIAHNLGSTPGMIIVKRTDAGTTEWKVWHRSTTDSGLLNSSVGFSTSDTVSGTPRYQGYISAATSTNFTVSPSSPPVNNFQVNANGGTYVAYLFAHDAGGFGAAGTDNVISCGSYTGDGTSDGTKAISLGYEPQWVLIKNSGSTGGDWVMFDNLRGVNLSGVDALLVSNNTSAEDSSANLIRFTSTGFALDAGGSSYNASGQLYVYVAIRRGLMRTPTSGTSVYNSTTYNGNGSATRDIPSIGVDAYDLIQIRRRNGTDNGTWGTRLSGGTLGTATTSTESTFNSAGAKIANLNGGYQNGVKLGPTLDSEVNASGGTYVAATFKRAPGFFDVVCYTYVNSSTAPTHSLSVLPELIITKRRTSSSSNWAVWHKGSGGNGISNFMLNGTDAAVAAAGNPATSTTTFTPYYVRAADGSSTPGDVVAYLFATCPGVSKVGSYTGTGTTKQIDCGFTAGARFVMIKRTDSTGDWYFWDTARGIIAGNDPYSLINVAAAEVTNTDYIDPYNPGFELSSTAPAALNASGGTYIFLAIA